MNWSSEQKSIFNYFTIGKGNAIVRARAGSGKTSTLIEGLNRANVSSALYITFNKKNQLDAEKKITNKNVTVKTAHSVGYCAILKNWKGVKASGWTEFGRIKGLEPEAPALVHFQCSRLVSFLKNTFPTVPTLKEAMDTAILRDIDCQKHADLWTTQRLAELAIKSMNLSLEYPKDKQISFDDMVWVPIIKGWIQASYLLCVGDEAQDFNQLQLKMIQDCCLPNGRICLVGDDRQAIYFFRGAASNGMDNFKSKLNAKEFGLTTSYRCPKSIIALAQAIVPDIKAQDTAIAGEITQMSHDKMLAEIQVKSVILSRNNAALVKSCLALLRKNKPAYCEGRDLSKTLISLIESFETNDINSFYNKLDGWLAVKQAKATMWNADSVANSIDTAETLRVIGESCLTVEDIKVKINKLFMDADYVRVPSVICSTVHRYKGNENPNIYLLEETFQSRRQMSPEQTMEEANIRYVAITRSQNKLVHVAG